MPAGIQNPKQKRQEKRVATVISCVNFCEGATNYTPIKKLMEVGKKMGILCTGFITPLKCVFKASECVLES